ncbi:godzilla E3 ubiquitin protein ligase isoform X1 [Dermacentor variabilis]|uniref:godzilla E3 ubiquitin protein ligase isoform X1 n=1 Tax=Dermacentor variabilis TaxID=34621 RepID=UPI003F5BCFB7
MFPHRRMPCHITILYVYSIISLTALFHATLVAAEIVAIPHSNSTPEIKRFFDQELSFSAMVPDEGVPGLLTIASPLAACQPIAPPPFPSNDSFAWFVLIARFECGLSDKAHFAQEAGYDVAVIYDRKTHNSGPFGTHITPEPKYYPIRGNGLKDTDDLNIYAVIVSEETGIRLKRYTYKDDYEVKLYPESFQSIFSYLLPFLAIVGVCIIGLLGFVCCGGLPQLVRCIRDWRKKRKSRLSRKFLRQLPTTKYKKGDIYETCAICLEDYVEGDKLRILPCSHAYHCKCIKPWLLHNRRTCPICKRKVILPGMNPNSDSETEDEGANATERTPLLAGFGGGGGGTFGGVPPLLHQPTEAATVVRGSSIRPILHTASFHQEDSGMPTSSSCPTHVSTAHSLNRDVDSSSISSGAEDEVQVRPGRSASAQGESQHHLRL